MGTRIRTMLADFGRMARKAGPYVVLEIVLPGGTLFALGLYLYRTGQLREVCDVRVIGRAAVRAFESTFDQLAFGLQPGDRTI